MAEIGRKFNLYYKKLAQEEAKKAQAEAEAWEVAQEAERKAKEGYARVPAWMVREWEMETDKDKK